ncbi:MAG TPA: AAA family ATPase [Candidatus Binataceae bacterium]|nr:AAA family ATPase [Candidatus Binataceae bacterium]
MAVIGKNEGRRGLLKVLLVGEPDMKRQQVAEVLKSLGDPALDLSEADHDGSGASPASAPDVAIVLFNGDEEASLRYLQTHSEGPSRPALFSLMEQRSQALMRRALRAGADELLFMPLEPADAARALLKVSEARRKEERRGGGTIISIVSTVGGVGVTSLTANLALALRHTLNKRVVAVDLDLQTGALGTFLNLEPDRTILQLCKSDRKLDSIQLETALAKHTSGLYLLAAPKRIEEAELVHEGTVGEVFELLRQLFDFVVVDCGGYVDENAVTAWEHSDLVLYVLEQSIASARCAWRFLDLFGRLGLAGAEPQFIVNRYHPHHPIGEAQISSTLGRPLFARMPDDERTLERVQMRAQDLWQVAPASPLARAVERLARQLNSGGPGAVQSTSLFGRLLSAIGTRN